MLTRASILGILLVCTTGVLCQEKACSISWIHSSSTNQCFLVMDYYDMSWAASREYCQSKGGELASFTSQLEQDTVIEKIKTDKLEKWNYWIGLNHIAKFGYYEWANNQPINFVSFASFDPNLPENIEKRCFNLMPKTSGEWMIEDCAKNQGFICKMPSKFNPTVAPPSPTLSPRLDYGCKGGWKYFEGRCYQADDQARTFTDARSACSNKTDKLGRLLTLSNEASSIMAGMLAQKSFAKSKLWLNLMVVSSYPYRHQEFYWPTDPMLFSRWNQFEPKDESCFVFDMHSFYWSASNCTTEYFSICQQSAEIIFKPTESPPDPGCPGEGWISSGRDCYYMKIAPVSTVANTSSAFFSRTMAENDCANKSSNLLSVDNIEEQYFVQEMLGEQNIRNVYIWLGIQFNNSIWRNEERQPVTFYYWTLEQQTQKDCAAIITNVDNFGKWFQVPCDSNEISGYICKRRNLFYTTPVPPTPTENTRPCPQGSGWFRVKNKCYNVYGTISDSKNWVDASTDCIMRGGQLASIHDKETNDRLTELLTYPGHNYVWIGLNAIDSDSELFEWSDNTPTDYFNWFGGAPQNHLGRQNCAQFYYLNGTWSTEVCAAKRPWLCKIEPGVIPPSKPPTLPPSTLPPGESCGAGNYKAVVHDLDYCYRIEEDTAVSWQTARELCMKDGGDLFSITKQADNDFLLGVINRYDREDFWIGLNELSVDGGYQWSDGTPVDYINWGPNQPDNSVAEYCVIFSRDNGFWFDGHCDDRKTFLCKRPRRGFIPKTPPPPPILPGYCPIGFTSAGSKCYQLFKEPVPYKLAQNKCQNMNAVLASVRNAFENSALIVLTTDLEKEEAWLGGRKATEKDNFRWEDNTRFMFTNWNHGQPTGSKDMCVSFIMTQSSEYQIGKWVTRPCVTESPYICMTYKSVSAPSPIPSPSSPCPAGYDFYENACFKYSDSLVTWNQAIYLCGEEKTNLASISDIFQQSRVHSLLKESNPGQMWIGMSRTKDSDGFEWSDARYVTYTKWGSTQPRMQDDSLCVGMQQNGTWAATNCQLKLPFVCTLNLGPAPTTEFVANGYCPSSEWQEHGNYCYHIQLEEPFDNGKSFSNAEFFCTQQRAHLISFRDRMEHKALLHDIERITHGQKQSKPLVWTGMFKLIDGTFAYKDQTPVDFFYWGKGEPISGKGDCVGMDIGSGDMKILPCSDSYGYICKIEKTPATTLPSMTTNEIPTDKTLPSSSNAPPNRDDFFSQLFKSKRANGLIAIFILLAFLILIAICLAIVFVMKRRRGGNNIFPLFGGSVNTSNNTATSFDNVYFDRNLDQVAMEDVDLEKNPNQNS